MRLSPPTTNRYGSTREPLPLTTIGVTCCGSWAATGTPSWHVPRRWNLAAGNGSAYANRGQVLLVLGRKTEAIADLREAIRLGPTLEPQVWLALAISKADAAEANGLCRAALELHGDDGLTEFRRGELRAWAYLILGEADAAETELRSAAEHHQHGEQFMVQEYELLADIPGIERLRAVRREIDEGGDA